MDKQQEYPPGFLRALQEGSGTALAPFIESVQVELYRRARAAMRKERRHHTLQPTALVNEAFLRLFGGEPIRWESKEQFLAAASGEMRRVLVDHARKALAQKRRSREIERLTTDLPAPHDDYSEILHIDRALKLFAKENRRAAIVVEMKHFGGFQNGEIATILKVTSRTVERDWALGRAWLRLYLSTGRGTGDRNDLRSS